MKVFGRRRMIFFTFCRRCQPVCFVGSGNTPQYTYIYPLDSDWMKHGNILWGLSRPAMHLTTRFSLAGHWSLNSATAPAYIFACRSLSGKAETNRAACKIQEKHAQHRSVAAVFAQECAVHKCVAVSVLRPAFDHISRDWLAAFDWTLWGQRGAEGLVAFGS